MATENEVLIVAREQAEKTIDAAIGELQKFATELGVKYQIPDNVLGHAVGDLLGRIAYVPSMTRDLRRELGQALAKKSLEARFSDAKAAAPAKTEPKALDMGVIPHGMALEDLDGVTVQVVKSLKAASLMTVGDVVKIPREHLVKINGLGEKSVAQLMAAIAKASQGPG